MSTSAINPLASAATPASPPTSTQALNKLADPNVFLQLLVAQLKYQDPENPADGTQFVTQLATFSQVGQSTQMVSDLDSIKALLSAPSPSTPPVAGSAPATTPATTSATTPATTSATTPATTPAPSASDGTPSTTNS